MNRWLKALIPPAVACVVVASVMAAVPPSKASRGATYTDADRISIPARAAPLRLVLWQPAQPVAGSVNSSSDEFEPRFSADGTRLVFVRGRAGAKADLFEARATPAGWTDPQPIVSVNTEADELGPELSHDGQTLYFYSDRPGGMGGYDLWRASWRDDRWADPVNLGPAVNTEFNEYGPALAPPDPTSPDAPAALYFSSNRPRPGEATPQRDPWPATLRESRDRHDYDLYTSLITAAGPQPAEPITALNTPDDEGSPAVSPIGDFLYFASDRPGGLGGFDLYRSRRLRGSHTAAQTLGPAINSAFNDLDPALSTDGFRLCFSSNRPPEQAIQGRIDLSPAVTASGPAGPSSPAATPAAGDAPEPVDYGLWASASREVFLEPAPAAQLAWSRFFDQAWPWLLLLMVIGGMALLLFKLTRYSRWKDRYGKLSLMARCLLLSIFLHMALASLLAVWRVGGHLGELVRGDSAGGTRIIVTSGARDGIARQITGSAGELPALSYSLPDMPAAAPLITAAVTAGRIELPAEPSPTGPAAPAISAIVPSTPVPDDAGPAPTHMELPPAVRAAPSPTSLPMPAAPEPARDEPALSFNPAIAGEAPPAAPPPSAGPGPYTANIAIAPSSLGGGEPPLALPHMPARLTSQETDTAQQPPSSLALPSTAQLSLSPISTPRTEPSIATTDEPAPSLDAAALTASLAAIPAAPVAAPTAPAVPATMSPIDLPPTSAGTTDSLTSFIATDTIKPAPPSLASAGPTAPNQLAPDKFAPPSLAPLNAGLLSLPSTPSAPPAAASSEPAASAMQDAGPARALKSLPPAPALTPRLSDSPRAAPSVVLEPAPSSVGDADRAPLPLPLGLAAPLSPPSSASTSPDPAAVATPAPPAAAIASNLIRLPAMAEPPAAPPEPHAAGDDPAPGPVETFAHRTPQARAGLLDAMGGNADTERAVARALDWLTAHQSADGHWSGRNFDHSCGRCPGEAQVDSDAALTAIALLCYLGAGHTHLSDGPYRESVGRALAWLLARQSPSGDLRAGETMYTQAVVCVALCESLAMTQDPNLRGPTRRAVDFLAAGPPRTAGRGAGSASNDTSVLGWQVMAMESARRAGLSVPPTTFNAARRWLDRVSTSAAPGLYAHAPRETPSPAMTAEAMFVQQLLGHTRDETRMKESARFILATPPRWHAEAPTYYWYYATLALFQQQGDAWKAWNEALVPELLQHQHQDGPAAGSWDPQDEWSRLGGRIYQTAICTLSLEVYYRYRPAGLNPDHDARAGQRSNPQTSTPRGR